MNTQSKSTKVWWLAFAVSMVCTILFLVFLPEWFWVMLPFAGTSFTLAMDWM